VRTDHHHILDHSFQLGYRDGVARTKEFDPDAALRAALDLFWRKGYEATSIQDLVDHLGIGRASLYATFGTKHDLYLRALDRYSEEMNGKAASALFPEGNALAAVKQLIRSFAEDAKVDPDRKGCFVTNTAIECLPHDELAARRVDIGLGGLESAIAGALVRAQSQGELSHDKDPYSLARFLVTLVQGIRVIAKRPDQQRLTDAVDHALSLLD
jgi:TetR/AcrR family transcriptional regulator, transcriptional repressor for nem operon